MGRIFAATVKTMSGAFRGTRCGNWGFSGDPQKDKGSVFRIMAVLVVISEPLSDTIPC